MAANPKPTSRRAIRSHSAVLRLAYAVRHRVGDAVSVDLRSLALLRIGLGALLLADLGWRAISLEAHYTDAGTMPRAAVVELFQGSYGWSLHLWHGSATAQLILFGVHTLFALMLVAGFRTRLSTIACWVLVVSLQHRNTQILNAGDTVLRLLLFWSMLLPLGARFSVDAWRRPLLRTTPDRLVTVASAALLLQIAAVYWFTAALKNNPVWREEGAVFFALSADHFATPFTHLLLAFPALFQPLSLAVLLIEGLGPCLAFAPFRHGLFRAAAVSLFIALHLGFLLFLQIGLFQLIMAVAWLAFLPSGFWDEWQRRLPDTSHERLRALRSAIRGWLDAASRAFERRASEARPGPLANAAAALLILYVFLINFDQVAPRIDPSRGRIIPANVLRMSAILGLDQYWGMFAPHPIADDGWYVVPGTLQSGRVVDAYRGGALSWEKPARVSAMYPSERWRKYMMILTSRGARRNLPFLSDYLCRRWNRADRESDPLVSLKIVFMGERTLKGYRVAPARPRLLYEHACQAPALADPPLVAAAKETPARRGMQP